MRKSTMTMAVATLAISLLIVGATLAWFTSEGEVTNLFATGDVAITLHDLLETEEATGDFPSEGISNVTPGIAMANRYMFLARVPSVPMFG